MIYADDKPFEHLRTSIDSHFKISGINMAYNQPQSQPMGYTTSPNLALNSAAPTHRLLHIYPKGMTHRHAEILDSDKQTPLYRIQVNSGGLFSSKPHVTVVNAASNALVGTVTFHSMSRKIDLTINEQPTTLSKSGIFTSVHEFRSSALAGSLKWKRDGLFSGGNMLCIDEKEQLFARFQASRSSMKKERKFELSPGVGGVLMDEIVVSGIAMVELMRRAAAAGAG